MHYFFSADQIASSGASALTRFKTRNGTDKPISPFLRAKQANNTNNPESENSKNSVKTADSNDSAAPETETNHTDAATKLSFNESDDADTKVINGSIEENSPKKVRF